MIFSPNTQHFQYFYDPHKSQQSTTKEVRESDGNLSGSEQERKNKMCKKKSEQRTEHKTLKMCKLQTFSAQQGVKFVCFSSIYSDTFFFFTLAVLLIFLTHILWDVMLLRVV